MDEAGLVVVISELVEPSYEVMVLESLAERDRTPNASTFASGSERAVIAEAIFGERRQAASRLLLLGSFSRSFACYDEQTIKRQGLLRKYNEDKTERVKSQKP